MAIFKQGDNSCYFIHIPRTGGRYLEELFEKNSAFGPWCDDYFQRGKLTRGIQNEHLHYPLYNYFLKVDNLIHFAVVRNPLDKIKSVLNIIHTMDNIDFNKIWNTEEKIYDFLLKEVEIINFHTNWFLPQHKFISNKTHIWRYEDGFGSKFYDWIYEKTKIHLEDNSINSYRKIYTIKDSKRKDVDESACKSKYNFSCEFEKCIKNFYKKDYELFGY